MPPVPPLASPDERPHGAKGRLRTSGSPRERQTRLKAPFPGPQRPLSGLSAAGWTSLWGIPHAPESSEAAVFHLKVSVGSRAGGQSALAKSEYIEREGRYAPDREELEHRESENMPEWAKDDPRSYWEAADEYERANGRLYREVQFALPKELSEDERRELASGFAKRLTEGERRPYTLAIHRGDGENPHAHLMFSERANDGTRRSREQWFRRYNRSDPEKGGARKSRAAMPPGVAGGHP